MNLFILILAIIVISPISGIVRYERHYSKMRERIIYKPPGLRCPLCNTQLHLGKEDFIRIKYDCNNCGGYFTFRKKKWSEPKKDWVDKEEN